MKDDGGSALPRHPGVSKDEWSGVTKREYFAAHALAGLCANMPEAIVNQIADGVRGGKNYVAASYILADAMIEEGKKGVRD